MALTRKKKTFTYLQIQDIIDSYRNGQSLADIASRYDCSRRPIHRILQDHEVPIRTNGEHNRAIVVDGKKLCSICKDWVILEDFYSKGDHYGTGYIVRSHACKNCMRKKWSDEWEHHVVKKYGITIEEYRSMLISRNNLCAICNQPEKRMLGDEPQRLAIDHCHTTGKVRGLLCNQCNSMIGMVEDNIVRLQKAIEYLKVKMR